MRLHPPMQGLWVQSLVRELTSHVLCPRCHMVWPKIKKKKDSKMPLPDLRTGKQSPLRLRDSCCERGGGGLVAKLCLTLATPWTIAHQAPLCMGFSRQEYWSGFPFPSPGDLPDPVIEPRYAALQADSLPTALQGKSCERGCTRMEGWG